MQDEFILCVLFQAHTILLVQPGPKPETRTFSDYESVNECMEGRLIILDFLCILSVYVYVMLWACLSVCL